MSLYPFIYIFKKLLQCLARRRRRRKKEEEQILHLMESSFISQREKRKEVYFPWVRDTMTNLAKWRDYVIPRVFGKELSPESTNIKELRDMVQKFTIELEKGENGFKKMVPPLGWKGFHDCLLDTVQNWEKTAEMLDWYLDSLEKKQKEEAVSEWRDLAIIHCKYGDERLERAMDIIRKSNEF